MAFKKFMRNLGRGINKIFHHAGKASHFMNNKIFGNYKKARAFVQKIPGLREGAKVLLDAVPGAHAVKDVVDTIADNYGTVDNVIQGARRVARDITQGKHKNIIKDTKNIIHRARSSNLGNIIKGFSSKKIIPVLKKGLASFSKLMPRKRKF